MMMADASSREQRGCGRETVKGGKPLGDSQAALELERSRRWREPPDELPSLSLRRAPLTALRILYFFIIYFFVTYPFPDGSVRATLARISSAKALMRARQKRYCYYAV